MLTKAEEPLSLIAFAPCYSFELCNLAIGHSPENIRIELSRCTREGVPLQRDSTGHHLTKVILKLSMQKFNWIQGRGKFPLNIPKEGRILCTAKKSSSLPTTYSNVNVHYAQTVITSVFPSKCLHRISQTKPIQVLYSTVCQTFQTVSQFLKYCPFSSAHRL